MLDSDKREIVKKEVVQKRVYLMGQPRVTTSSRKAGGLVGEETLRISAEDITMEPLALVLLSWKFLTQANIAGIGVKNGTDVRRDWLLAMLTPKPKKASVREETLKQKRDNLNYRLKKLHEGLAISAGSGSRESVVFKLKVDTLWVDVLEIAEAAKHLHVPGNREKIIELAERPLLEGRSYTWVQEACFQEISRTLDIWYLTALLRQADSRIVQMKHANAAGRSAEANVCRTEALPLLDQAADRLHSYGGRLRQLECHSVLAFEAQFATLRLQADYQIASKTSLPVSVAPSPSHIPRYLTSFIGRDNEKRNIHLLLSTERLVTLTGIGGCGKTRLALEVATEIQQAGSHEVHFIRLEDMARESSEDDPELLPRRVLSALGLETQRNCLKALIGYLQQKPTLLLLDNCEHLIQACAELVQTLLQSCPPLRVLTTSRASLNIDGEYFCHVLPLGSPDLARLSSDSPDAVHALLQYDAVRLFLDRVRPHGEVSLSPAAISAVAAICASLDGIPLALEFAAARTKLLSLEEIAEMLAGRFRLLTAGRRTALPRHKTLQAVFDWSYNLLNEPEQALLCRLSVFQGGWTLEAAEVIGASEALPAPDVLNHLASLADKNLIQTVSVGTSSRFGMLQIVHQYAQDQLRERGEWQEARRRHRDYFFALAEEAEPHLRGSEQKFWLDRLEAEHDNFRAALGLKADEKALRLACALQRFWWVRGYSDEGFRWIEREIDDSAGVSERVKAIALIGAGRLAYVQGRYKEAQKMFQGSLALQTQLGDARGIAIAHNNLADAAFPIGEYKEAEMHYQTSLTEFRKLDDKEGIADALMGLGTIEQNQSQCTTARERHTESLKLRRDLGDPQGIADSLMCLNNIAFRQGDLAEARTTIEDCFSILQRLNSRKRLAECLIGFGRVALAEGNLSEAQALLEQSLALSQEVGHQWIAAQALNYLASIAYDQQNYVQVEAFLRRSLALMERLGAERAVAALQGNLGAALTKLNRFLEAIQFFRLSLTKFRQIGDKENIAATLEEYAILEAAQGRSKEAAILWGSAEMLAKLIDFHRPANEDARYNQAVSDVREVLGEEAFARVWMQGQSMPWDQAVAYALGETSTHNSGTLENSPLPFA